MARMTSKAISPEGRYDPAKASSLSLEARKQMIGEAAYYRYMQRGCAPGHELDDWLAAEAEFERASVRQQPPIPATIPNSVLHQSGSRGPREDDALKRMIRQHPRRDISRIEGIEPEDAPLKE